ncbi:hypothetical protein ACOMHN_020113 [Nucella lapillus]
MFFARVLWIWVFTFTYPGVSALKARPDPEDPLLSRLDRLEGLLADQQNRLHLLQKDVHALHKEKQIQTQTLLTENQAPKTDLREVQGQVRSLEKQQHPLQDLPTLCGTRQSSQDGELQKEEDKNVTQRQKESSPPQHVLTARSDDQRSLEVVTNQLAQHVALLAADVQALKTSDAQQQQDIQAARGSTFIHWGSSTCAGSSELVYSGVVGGSWYDHEGGATKAVCLSMTPMLQDWPAHLAVSAGLYGGEYQTYDSHHQDGGAVCAVCRPLQSTTVMVPGTNLCSSSGWTLQYSGYLMVSRADHHSASQYVCVDARVESATGSQPANDDGYLFHYTMTHCGRLPCPPYQDGKRVTCAVCSK